MSLFKISLLCVWGFFSLFYEVYITLFDTNDRLISTTIETGKLEIIRKYWIDCTQRLWSFFQPDLINRGWLQIQCNLSMKRGIRGSPFKWSHGGLMDLDVIYSRMSYCPVCKGFLRIVTVTKSKPPVIGSWHVWYSYTIRLCHNGSNKPLRWSLTYNNAKNIIIFPNLPLIERTLDHA